jgi:cbb3-type cytochrome oxidase subunit 3
MFTLTDLDLLFAPSMRWLRGPLLLVVLCLAAKVWFANRREFRKVRRCGGASRLGLICRSSVAVQWLMLASAAAFLWGALLWQAALSLLAIACAATAFHNARRRRRDAARACPRCAGMDTLKPESSGQVVEYQIFADLSQYSLVAADGFEHFAVRGLAFGA